ncbi:hypothetical protein Clst_1966 [Thermoclostridium stercorarium subsp. stercorarium DSM 8532]|nr:hypothetical protein Clst_1966 [Thermoclostridium stercorarium subsp. stercorarium DSM 8532]
MRKLGGTAEIISLCPNVRTKTFFISLPRGSVPFEKDFTLKAFELCKDKK